MKNFRPSFDPRAENPDAQLTAAQYHHLLDSVLALVFTLDQNGRFVYVNTASINVWGYTPLELIGKCCLEMVFEEDREKTSRYLKDQMDGQQVEHFQNLFWTKDRRLVPVSWAGRWVEADQNLYCVARDFSERKKRTALLEHYKDQLEKQNESMVSILERITDGFFAVDHNWTITYWNGQAEKLTTRLRKDMVGKNFWLCFPQRVGTESEVAFRKALSEQVHINFESPSVICSGQLLEFSVYPSRDGLTVFYRDITQRKRKEEQIRKLSLVAEKTENAVVMLGLDEKITWVNSAFTRLTGYSFEEAIGHIPSKLLQGKDTNPETLQYINERLQKRLPIHVEIMNYKKNGEPFWSELDIQPLYDANGQPEQFFSIRKDITERKKFEQELAKQQKKITAAVIRTQERERAEVGRELHDNVNQVLTSVKLYQELIQSGIGNVDELVKKSIDLLQGAINENRNLSRRLSAPTLGKIKLIDSVKELVDTVAATRKFEIGFFAETIEGLEVNEELHLTVYRILQEHLTNVSKYAEAGRVDVTLALKEGRLEVEAYDDGQGFDPAQKRKGIGVTNMIMRAEHLKGTLTIDSVPGKGCRMRAWFPIN